MSAFGSFEGITPSKNVTNSYNCSSSQKITVLEKAQIFFHAYNQGYLSVGLCQELGKKSKYFKITNLKISKYHIDTLKYCQKLDLKNVNFSSLYNLKCLVTRSENDRQLQYLKSVMIDFSLRLPKSTVKATETFDTFIILFFDKLWQRWSTGNSKASFFLEISKLFDTSKPFVISSHKDDKKNISAIEPNPLISNKLIPVEIDSWENLY